ncbi:D-amino-acid dehydrogenase [Plasticicumulans lactativorans]|uniref:D-amino acid dehydrogenase n=1 Tax=Plasticicumulans lactativorans TaxID=1133106 RepID=A0A4R2LN39_9GAMM|nr:D-amino acid dehydrogenase [Plasticicumulans lactativorans]TCO80875.1 D-amino-acid dehydrogenase [Plasticicumulans lactativorans]
MKIVVLGSGVVGTSTAYYLAKAGHEVVVLERQPGPALETSYANAGQISPGYSAPWAGPGVPLKALKWMFMEHAPLVLRLKFNPEMWRWMWEMLMNCNARAYEVNKSRMMRLAEYSRDQFVTLRADTGISYDDRQQGTLQLFRTQKQVDDAAKDIAVLRSLGVGHEVLDRAGCVAAEPALELVCDKIQGGLRLPGDETGDCFKFTQRLAEMAAGLGVQFMYGTAIFGLDHSGGEVTGVQTNRGRITGDAYICALGSYSTKLMRELGYRIPVFPVKGYSITVPITDPAFAPVSTVMDETHKVAITRLGDRIRVAGTAELTGYDLQLTHERGNTVRHVVTDLFPRGGDVSRAELWTGLRPNTPDGTPIIGATPLKRLYLNTGHGTLGWTMSCGSARVISDIVTGAQPDIDTAGLGMDRYA